MPAKAAQVVQYNNANYPQDLLQKLAAKLQCAAGAGYAPRLPACHDS